MIGLVAGLSAMFAIDAAGAAGQMASASMGLSYGSVIDPVHGADSTAISELITCSRSAALVMSGMHREAIAWLCRSVIQMPPGATVGVDVTSLASAVVTQAIASAALAVRMAFPILVAVFFGHVVAGRGRPHRAPAQHQQHRLLDHDPGRRRRALPAGAADRRARGAHRGGRLHRRAVMADGIR